MGGSEHINLDLRVELWLETLPLLLEKTKIKHVSLFCHSAGAVYTMNTMYKFRHILDPRAPMVFFIAPWVDASISHSVFGNIISLMPAGMIRAEHSIMKVFTSVSPSLQQATAMSSGLLEAALPASLRGEDKVSLEAERYGCDNATAKEISQTLFKYIWTEETKAVNDEALTCFRKTRSNTWCDADDYAALIREVSEQEWTWTPPPQSKLRIRAYFAESDGLVGSGGRKYVESCFAQAGIPEHIDFKSEVKAKTGHDSIMTDHRLGPLVEVFQYVGNVLKP